MASQDDTTLHDDDDERPSINVVPPADPSSLADKKAAQVLLATSPSLPSAPIPILGGSHKSSSLTPPSHSLKGGLYRVSSSPGLSTLSATPS